MQVASIVLNVFIIFMMSVLILDMFILCKGKLPRKENKYVLGLCFLSMLASLTDIICSLVNGDIEYTFLNRVSTVLLFSNGFLISIVMVKYVNCIFEGKGIESKRLPKVVVILAVIGIVLDMLSIKNEMYFSIQGGYYKRGSYFIINQFLGFCIVLCIGYACAKNRKALGDAQFFSLISYLFLPFCAIIGQLFMCDFMLLYPAIALSVLIISGLSYQEQRREMEEKLLRSQIDIMMTQIKPHFMYNSLTAIYGMCEKDPKKAKRAIADFAKYLRNNIDSIGKREMISFDQELKHIETYLNLEKLRFDERIKVVYDIEVDHFMVPALCIQPLVENGIKYGIAQREEGGELRLSTKETEDNFLVIVEDTGVGFDYGVIKNDGRVHVGIDNVRIRIESMCGGRLQVNSERGKGTIAIVTIPKSRNRKILEGKEIVV